MLDLLSGEVDELRLEQRGSEGLGVEFCRVSPNGQREYHSVKRQAPDSAGRWTPAQITKPFTPSGRSVLGDLFGHLEESGTDAAIFVSQDGVQHLREAAERARTSANLDEFLDLLSSAQRDAFNERVAPLTSRTSDAYAKLRNCKFVTIEHGELVRVVEQRIAALIDRQDGAPAAPGQVRMLLEEFAWSRLGQAINTADVARKLNEHGYREHRSLSQGQSRERMRARTHAYIGRIEQALINGAQIPRALSASIVEQLKTGKESLLLSGGPVSARAASWLRSSGS